VRWVLGIALVVASCTKARDDQPQPPPVTPAPVHDPDQPPTTQTLASQFDRCWGHYNAARWDAYKGCFAPNTRIELPGLNESLFDVDEIIAEAKQHPDERAELALVVGADTTIIGVVRLGKRHVVDVVEYDTHGRVAREQRYFDASIPRSTPLAIGATKRVVIGSGARSEQENAAVVGQLVDAWGGPPFADRLAGDLAWSEPWFEGNLDKARVLAHVNATSTIDQALRVTTTWFAGDFVVVRGKLEGRVDKSIPALGIATPVKDRRFDVPFVAIFELAGGKVRAASLVWQTASFYKQIGIAPRTTPLP
jgi:hypothetical protein